MTASVETNGNVQSTLPDLAEATKVWFQIGILSFGGPAGQIALMHRILVDERKWISEPRFLHALNYCMLLPGPEAQQLATYIGWLLHGTRGGVIAGTLFVLPGFFVILALSIFYALFIETYWVASVFFGLKAAVLAIVLQAVVKVGRRTLKNRAMVTLALAAFLAIFAFNVPFPIIVLAAGLIGFWGARFQSEPFTSAGQGDVNSGLVDAMLDAGLTDVRPSAARAVNICLVWGTLWVAPILLLVVIFGSESVFIPIAGFFSKMAVVTFGGAYAVLAYVAQQAVETHGWLNPNEMLDGLALAETTPGPLVLVLTFVGFLAAFRDNAGIDPLLSGFLGAFLTTWVTFVPCFLWIFLGAPYTEKLRSHKALSGALTAITSAIVGVILNLAVWFGLHVMFRKVGEIAFGPIRIIWPEFTSVDLLAVILFAFAAFALLRLNMNMIATLAICGLTGWLAQSLVLN